MNAIRIAMIGGGLGAIAWWMASRSELDAGGGVESGGGVDDWEFMGGLVKTTFGSGQQSRRRISFAGIQLIKQFEGFRGQVYDANPPQGDWTIGYGHKLKAGESFQRGVTEAEAQALLIKDVSFAEDRVYKNITRALTQSQFDALVSLAYNLTTRSWLAAAARINAGETGESVFNRYVYAGGTKLRGLVIRRAAEVALYYGNSGGVA